MQIIDDKGRIFKKFNLLDLSIVLFVILCVTVFYIRIMHPEVLEKKISDIHLHKEITFKIHVDTPTDIERYVSEGDIYEGIEGCHAKVEKIEKHYKHISGQMTYIITFKARVLVNDKGEFFYGVQPIKLGKGFSFSNSLYEISGNIRQIEGASFSASFEPLYLSQQKKEVIVEIFSADLWLADYISIGDREEL